MNAKIRILIVDDHFMARLGLSIPISREADMAVVGEARNGAEALTLYREHQPDVVTMDYRLPDAPGTDAALSIRGGISRRSYPHALGVRWGRGYLAGCPRRSARLSNEGRGT